MSVRTRLSRRKRDSFESQELRVRDATLGSSPDVVQMHRTAILCGPNQGCSLMATVM
jgi:hypothetical protein